MHNQVEAHGIAERLAGRSNRILWSSVVAFICWQGAYLVVFQRPESAMRAVDWVVTAGLLAWAAALLTLLATGGGLFAKPEVRAILDDELARSHRAVAYRNAFWMMLAVAFAGYVAAQLMIVSARDLAHVVLSAGVIVAALTVARLNRQ